MDYGIEQRYAEQYAPTDWRSNKVAHYTSNVQGRADWLPDQSVMNFVRDFISETFPEDRQYILDTDETWVPLSILSTLEWIKIGGWWLFAYGSVGFSEEQYESIWKYSEGESFTEHDPESLIIFLMDRARNYFQHRWSAPGLTDQEHVDLIPFIERVGFPQWKKRAPPQEVTEVVVWATLLWVLSENGFDWARDVDIIFDYTAEDNRSFLSADEDSDSVDMRLLNPMRMHSTGRPVGTCAGCGTNQYCVDGYLIAGNVRMKKSEQANSAPQFDPGWVHLCNRCAVHCNDSQTLVFDSRVSNPMCGNRKCMNTSCPHLQTIQDQFGNRISQNVVEAGQKRQNEFERFIEDLGASPRQLSGQTLEDVLQHFHVALGSQ